MVDFVIQCTWRAASTGSSRNERDALSVVVCRGSLRRLPLRKNDESGAIHVEMGVHRRRALLTAREGEAHVGPVPHVVGGQHAEDGINDLCPGVHVPKPQRLGRTEQAV